MFTLRLGKVSILCPLVVSVYNYHEYNDNETAASCNSFILKVITEILLRHYTILLL